MEVTRLEFYVADIATAYVPSQKSPVTAVTDAYNILYNCWSPRLHWLEDFYLVALDTPLNLIGIYHIASGGLDMCYVDMRVLFQVALGSKASRIILAHNHPSGSIQPSEADKQLTSQVKAIGDLLKISVIDHIILTPEYGRYYSFADAGLIREDRNNYNYVYDSIKERPETVVF